MEPGYTFPVVAGPNYKQTLVLPSYVDFTDEVADDFTILRSTKNELTGVYIRRINDTNWEIFGPLWTAFVENEFYYEVHSFIFQKNELDWFDVVAFDATGLQIGTPEESKWCLVIGDTFAEQYQPLCLEYLNIYKIIPEMKTMLLRFGETEYTVDLSFSVNSKTGYICGAAFEGRNWERLCAEQGFSVNTPMLMCCMGEDVDNNYFRTMVLTNANHRMSPILGQYPMNDDNGHIASFSIVITDHMKEKKFVTIPTSFVKEHGLKGHVKAKIRLDQLTTLMDVKNYPDKRIRCKSNRWHVVLYGDWRSVFDSVNLKNDDEVTLRLYVDTVANNHALLFDAVYARNA